ncbi:MAG: hypothetical protein HOI95_25095 [Chromatiales bacterium]|jgi:hypothetical protein|nr:hypothetical protein [Chromatiales bacterium]
MMDHQAAVERLTARLTRLHEQVAEHEAMAAKARGPLSESFQQHLTEPSEECRRVRLHIADEQLHQALSWRGGESGSEDVVDEVVNRDRPTIARAVVARSSAGGQCAQTPSVPNP